MKEKNTYNKIVMNNSVIENNINCINLEYTVKI